MKNLLTALFVVLCCSATQAQNLADFQLGKNDFYDEGHWGFALSYSAITNRQAPSPDNHNASGFAMKIDWKKYRAGSGERRFFYQNKSLGDMIFVLGSEIRRGTGVERGENSALSNLVGWSSWGWNVVSSSKLNVAAGFNLNDYMIGSTYIYRTGQVAQSPVTLEPQGYYWGGGPSAFVDYLVNDKLMIQGFAAYSIAGWRAVSVSYATVDNNYPKPHFLHLNLELQSNLFHLYGGIEYCRLINRGDIPNNTTRFDLIIGYRF
ncbi:MAG: hypothetical protein KF775_05630 [Cyclobacteriaceae bacterium]|nr:hypothetical protein [Cyclobacteriaceae bacterium]